MKNSFPFIRAAKDIPPSDRGRLAWSVPVEITAAAGDAKTPPRFSMIAYNGGALNLTYWSAPVVVDLQGLQLPARSMPIFRDHYRETIIGHSDKVEIIGGKVRIEGVISGSGPKVSEVVNSAANGFPWQASIGARPIEVESVDEGATAVVNGKSFDGPMFIARKSQLSEASFVALGADDRTSARVAASLFVKETQMQFSTWLKARGLNAAEMSDEETAAQRLIFDAEIKAKATVAPAPVPLPKQPVAPVIAQDPADEAVLKMNAAMSANAQRIADIHAACGFAHAGLVPKAISEGWSKEKVQLEVLLASRPTAPAFIQGAGRDVSTAVLEAAVRLGSDEPSARVEADRSYTPQILDAASKLRRMGIRALIEHCCRIEGRAVPSLSDGPDVWASVGFSTVSLPGVLSNTANKMLMSAYQAVPSFAPRVAVKLSARDFKTHTGYRIGSGKVLPKVGPGGELTHGKLSEGSFSFFVDTYGQIIGLTRQMMVNDDLGAFAAVPLMIGEKAGYTREQLFWALVIANTGDFFHANNSNVVTAAPINAAGYDKATQAMEEMTDADGNRILIIPSIVVVPPALAGAARRARASTNMIVVGMSSTSAKNLEGSANVYDYEPISVPFLSGQDGNWYLFPQPGNEAAFGIAYLNGVEGPVVEDCPLSGDLLGKAWRGYFDVGVCQVNSRRAIRATTT